MTDNDLVRAWQRSLIQPEQRRDLTCANPTALGLLPPELPRFPAPTAYQPDPQGTLSARQAIADTYRRHHGLSIDPEQLLLCASTSEAYSLLFKTFCDPGDNILVPCPSYPLLPSLTRLDGLQVREYPLHFDGEWSIDLHALEACCDARTRAILVISPNNPTAHLLRRDEAQALARICASRGVILISDEVFSDFVLRPSPDDAPLPLAHHYPDIVAFSLNGLSKSCGLPQHKLAWILSSPAARADPAIHGALTYVADAYLSVSAWVQAALPHIFAGAPSFQHQVRQRLHDNLNLVETHCSDRPYHPLPYQGGWSLVLRLPHFADDERIAVALAAEGLLTHPGAFFSFAGSAAFLVISLLTPTPWLRQACEHLDRFIHHHLRHPGSL